MTDTAVRFENLSKFYKLYYSPKDRLKEALSPFGKKRHREFYALKNINLEIKKGEILGVVGRNGSGKSTLLSIISGFIQPNSGTKMVTGRLSALLDLGFGMNPNFDGFQNIYFGGIMLGFSKQEMKGKIDEIIAFADIGEFIRQPMRTYSAGMKARLGFALAISVNPDILIVDEVLAVGDDLFRRKCFSKMEEIIAKGCTIIYVSHAINTVNELCSRAILLDRGELILDGPPKWVTANYQKLIFALPDSQEKIRGQLLAMNENNAPQSACRDRYLPAEPPAIPESKSFFIPGFTSQSAIVVKNGAVDIFDIQLKNPAGQTVNAVVMHEKLIYSYKVKFNADAHGIIFSMAIKNEKGLNISARKTGELVGPNKYGTILQEVKAGSCCEVQWEFVNTLLPGVYFTNAAVFKVIPGEDTHVLIRITDALVFKVQDTRDPLMNGIVDLHQEFNIRLTGT
ncbi:MAG: lipopolysaccharide transport system ATP-binding protein [Acidobacteriota bacterium]|nr:lipopolysaccharide transport system ATP-binding protein [Acidobacteriota bacterium]